MSPHFTKLSPKSAADFSTAAESVLYFLLEEDELITLRAWHQRFVIYCQQKPDNTKGLRCDWKTTTDNANILVAKGYVKELSADSIERLLNFF